MVKVAWKTINGYGPYAYLQKSVKSGGKVTSKHIAYLGAAGVGKDGIALVPGKNFNAPAAEDFPGGRLRIPLVGDETEGKLKPKQKAAVEYMEKQAKAGVPTSKIITGLKALPAKLKKRVAKKKTPVGASPKSIKAAAEAAGKPSVGATPAGIKAAVKAAGKPSAGATPAAAKLAAGKKADDEPAFEPKVPIVPVNTKGELLLSAENVDKLEAAGAKGVAELDATAKTVTANLKTTAEKTALSVAVGYMKEQIQKAGALGADAVQQQVDKEPYKKVTILDHLPPKSQAASETPKVGDIPLNNKGKPLVSKANIKKLEEAAAKSEFELKLQTNGIADGLKTAALKTAVFKVGAELMAQIQTEPAQEYSGKVAPKKSTKQVQQPSPTGQAPKVTDVPLNNKGKPLISKANVKKLEAAAAQGIDELDTTAKTITDKLLASSKKAAVLNAAEGLKKKILSTNASSVLQTKAVKEPSKPAAGPKVKNVPTDIEGKPAVSEANIKKLEAAAAKGAKDLDATAKEIAGELTSPKNKLYVLSTAKSLKKQITGDTTKEAAIKGVAPNAEIKADKPLKTAVASGPPKIDPKDHTLVSKANIKKLEAAAALGVKELDDTAKSLVDGLKLTKKKAAILSASWSLRTQILGLQEGDGGSGLSQTMDDVDDGKLKLPKQDTPSLKVMQQQEQILKAGNKNYDSDLVKVSGKKGSNRGRVVQG